MIKTKNVNHENFIINHCIIKRFPYFPRRGNNKISSSMYICNDFDQEK